MKPVHYLLIASLLTGSIAQARSLTDQYGYRTNYDARIHGIVSQFREDADKLNQEVYRPKSYLDKQSVEELVKPWWEVPVQKELLTEAEVKREKTVSDMITEALQHSHKLRVFHELPLIEETEIMREKGAFDTIAFLEGSFDRTNEPVSDSLTNPSGDRFIQYEHKLEGGFKKKFMSGTQAKLSQLIGNLDSNSQILDPNPQGSAELKLRVIQPLLRGSGFQYNTTKIRIAEIETDTVREEFINQVQDHLFQISLDYWCLYQARAIYLQQQKLYEEGVTVLKELEQRRDLDTNSRQLARARAAVSMRKTLLVRAEIAVLNAQDKLKVLINSPDLSAFNNVEILTDEVPSHYAMMPNLYESAIQALEHRPEIQKSFNDLHLELLENKVARNEVMPTLNVFLEGRLRGLAEDKVKAFRAVDQQFKKQASYAVGFNFEMPLENREARSAKLRSKYQIRRRMEQVFVILETVLMEVKVYAREVHTSYRDVIAKYESLQAAKEDYNTILARKDVDAYDQKMETSTYLEFLLDSQDRLAQAEADYVNAQIAHVVAQYQLEKTKGTFIQYNDVETVRTQDNKKTPRLHSKRNTL